MFESESKLLNRAFLFAEKHHEGQLRKFTGRPYIVHPVEVTRIAGQFTEDESVLAAAMLHDVIEDTAATYDDVLTHFGERVAGLVVEVTQVSVPEDGVRKVRKELDRVHFASASPDGQTIKLADIFSNARDVATKDPGFAKVYLPEQIMLAKSLTEGNKYLRSMVLGTLDVELEMLALFGRK